MLVRMRTTLVGPDGTINADEIADVPEAVARQLVQGRYAVFETAMIDTTELPVEVAALVTPTRRGRPRQNNRRV
jgi:pentose-5-phosphate-3-epimerase